MFRHHPQRAFLLGSFLLVAVAAVAADKPASAEAVWKKLEPFWDVVIRAKRVSALLPALESVLTGFGRESRAQITELSVLRLDDGPGVTRVVTPDTLEVR